MNGVLFCVWTVHLDSSGYLHDIVILGKSSDPTGLIKLIQEDS